MQHVPEEVQELLRQRLPLGTPPLELGVVDEQVERPGGHVQPDPVPVTVDLQPHPIQLDFDGDGRAGHGVFERDGGLGEHRQHRAPGFQPESGQRHGALRRECSGDCGQIAA